MSIEQIQLFLGIAIIVIMLGMGLSLTISDFSRITKNPKAVITGLIAQLLVLPVLGYAVIQIFSLTEGAAIGVMLMAACPGGATSNMLTFLARGDMALSVTMTAFTSLLTVLSIPFIIDWSLAEFIDYTNTEQIVNKGEFFKVLVLLIIVPITLGMIIRKFKPNIASKSEKPVKVASVVLLVSIILVAVITNKDTLVEALPSVGPAVILLNLLTMTIGFFAGKLLSLPGAQKISIAIECGIQNGTLALGLGTIGIMGSYPEILLPPALYSVWMFFSGGAFAYWMYKKHGKNETTTS